jgi:hypothetical protein
MSLEINLSTIRKPPSYSGMRDGYSEETTFPSNRHYNETEELLSAGRKSLLLLFQTVCQQTYCLPTCFILWSPKSFALRRKCGQVHFHKLNSPGCVGQFADTREVECREL